jgi:hypothetical protein
LVVPAGTPVRSYNFAWLGATGKGCRAVYVLEYDRVSAESVRELERRRVGGAAHLQDFSK